MKAKTVNVSLANPIFLEYAFSGLSSLPNMTTGINYALVTKNWLDASHKSGGDAVDLSPTSSGFVRKL